MTRTLLFLSVAALMGCQQSSEPAGTSSNATKTEAPAAKLSLARLDCGAIHVNAFDKSFSDRPGLYPSGPRDLTDSCYLIRHGDQVMLWNSGLSEALIGKPATSPEETMSLSRSLVDQLKSGGVTPEQIDIIGISHFHADHTGQAKRFPGATLMIGKADFDALKAKSDDAFFKLAQADLKHWLSGGGKVEPVAGDKDVFGDGSVMMIDLPGHTPGHHALLIKLQSGPVLLSGDLYHATEARMKRGVPGFNTDRAQTLASMDKFEALAKQTGAKVVIEHERADIPKVPAFPKVTD